MHMDPDLSNSYPSKSYVMISYSWANKEDVNMIIEKLKPYLNIWRDISHLAGSSDLWNSIALAVQEAEFFIPIISAEYEKSDSCTNELNFALNNKQIVVPIFLDPSFKPTGSVGLRISKLYYMIFQEVVEKPFSLIKHLNTMGANHLNLNEDKHHQIRSLKVPIEDIYNLSMKNGHPSRPLIQSSKENMSRNRFDKQKPKESLHVDPKHRGLDFSTKNGFNIHQKNADETQFDIYSSDKDDSFSYQCSGKFVSIVDFDYVNMDELNKSQMNESNTTVSQLIFEEVQSYFNCFVLINDESLLLATQNGNVYHLVLNDNEQKYLTYNLEVKFNTGDLELFKNESKQLVDMCLDPNGNVIVLIKNKLSRNSSYSYSVELFNLNTTKGNNCLKYNYTLFTLNSEGQSEKSLEISSQTAQLKCLFTRIYSFESELEQSIVLIDRANKRIMWYKKSNGLKVRCIKTVENNLEDLRSFATIDDENQIFLCSKAGLFCLKRNPKAANRNCRIKHFDSLKACFDICYDFEQKHIIFIDAKSVFRGKFYDKLETDENFKNSQLNETFEKEPLLKYKLLFTNNQQLCKDGFKRVLLGKRFIFILANSENINQKNSIYLIDKHKLDGFRS